VAVSSGKKKNVPTSAKKRCHHQSKGNLENTKTTTKLVLRGGNLPHLSEGCTSGRETPKTLTGGGKRNLPAQWDAPN